jgi:hypothetical protein
MKVTAKNITVEFRFVHAGIPATIKSVCEDKTYASFVSDDGSESGTIAMEALLSIINRNFKK